MPGWPQGHQQGLAEAPGEQEMQQNPRTSELERPSGAKYFSSLSLQFKETESHGRVK